MPSPNEQAVELLNTHLAALPHPEYGVINMLPFSHDSDQVRAIKRQVCEAIVNLLHSYGHLKTDGVAEPTEARVAVVKCRAGCPGPTGDGVLVQIPVDPSGVGMVDFGMLVAGLLNLNPACPHRPITMDDHRRRMEAEFFSDACKGCGAETRAEDLTDGVCKQCGPDAA